GARGPGGADGACAVAGARRRGDRERADRIPGAGGLGGGDSARARRPGRSDDVGACGPAGARRREGADAVAVAVSGLRGVREPRRSSARRGARRALRARSLLRGSGSAARVHATFLGDDRCSPREGRRPGASQGPWSRVGRCSRMGRFDVHQDRARRRRRGRRIGRLLAPTSALAVASVPSLARAETAIPVQASYEKNRLTVETDDGNYRLRLQNRLQFRYAYPFDPDPRSLEDLHQDLSSFMVRRARFKLEGHAFRPWLMWNFQYDWSQPVLRDFSFDI